MDDNSSTSVNSFAKTFFGDDTADDFQEFMKAKKFPMNVIQKDIADLQSQLRFRKMVFSNSIKFTAPPEAFKEMVTIETIDGEATDGSPEQWTRITIRDHIREES